MVVVMMLRMTRVVLRLGARRRNMNVCIPGLSRKGQQRWGAASRGLQPRGPNLRWLLLLLLPLPLLRLRLRLWVWEMK